MSPRIVAGYMNRVLNPELLPLVIKGCLSKLDGFGDFGAIAFSGMSGAAVSFPISHMTGIPLICVRKHGEPSHSIMESKFHGISGAIFADRYLIIDDLIDSGATIFHIMEEINLVNDKAKCIGVLLWNYGPPDLEYKGEKIPVVQLDGDLWIYRSWWQRLCSRFKAVWRDLFG